jgi:hypothetical protein
VMMVILLLVMALTLMYGIQIGVRVATMGFQTYTSSLESKPAQ